MEYRRCSIDSKADVSSVEELANQVNNKADKDALDVISGILDVFANELDSISDKLIGLAAVNAEQDNAISLKADSSSVYTIEEVDRKIRENIVSGSGTNQEELLELSGALVSHITDYNNFYKDFVSVKTLVSYLANGTAYGLRSNWSASSYTSLTALTNGNNAVPVRVAPA